MIIVDAHCDTVTRIMEEGGELYSNQCHIDIERLRKAGSFVQFFASYIEPVYCQAYAMKRAVQIIDRLYREVSQYEKYISVCLNYSDIEQAMSENKVAAMISIEEGEALQGDLSALRMFYKLGVRSICLTWNYRNSIADGVKDSSAGGGLTPFGREVIKEMNALGMLIDLSHIAEKGFWDVMEETRTPVIVSHSNAKKICSHKRNLNDEQLLAVRKNGGVVGINLYPYFLNETCKATLKDIMLHIEHIISLTGSDHIGLGADFDGIESTPEDVQGVQDIHRIFEEMAKLNYSQEVIDKFAGENFLRVIKQVINY